jgi:hypothetical protein
VQYYALTIGGHYVVAADDPFHGPLVRASGTGVGPDSIFERVPRGRAVALRPLSRSSYVSAPAGGGALTLAATIGPTEEFNEVEMPDDSIALRTSTGTFVCAEGGGGRELVGNRSAIGPWERFFREVPPAALLPAPPVIDVTQTLEQARAGGQLTAPTTAGRTLGKRRRPSS